MGGVMAVVVAAGRGQRMGAAVNKVFLPLAGRPMLVHTLAVFEEVPEVDGVIVVAAPHEVEACRRLVHEYRLSKVTQIVPGGRERQDSVARGVEALPAGDGVVLVHDGARPFLSSDLVRRVVAEARSSGAVIPVVPVKDTVKRVGDGWVECTVDRSRLVAVQTPQGFQKAVLTQALAAAFAEGFYGTDESSLVERYVGRVKTIPGEEGNIKVTTPFDLAVATCLMGEPSGQRQTGPLPGERQRAAGFGFDAHRFVAGRPLILCGVNIPFELGLDGHSDADVALHALADALLGAAGMGDIGRHFPDTDERFRGISSTLIIREVLRMIREAGWVVENADLTIVAQRPRLKPFFDAMRECLSTVMGLPVSLINVKATTTEGMGFTGRGEGVAAFAVVSITRHIPPDLPQLSD